LALEKKNLSRKTLKTKKLKTTQALRVLGRNQTMKSSFKGRTSWNFRALLVERKKSITTSKFENKNTQIKPERPQALA